MRWRATAGTVQIRMLSADVARKEDLIKELRAKIRPLDLAQEALDAKEEQLNTTKEALKKARTDLERKEQAASSARSRVQAGLSLPPSIPSSPFPASILSRFLTVLEAKTDSGAVTQECEAQKESIKQLETSLARVQRLVVSKSDEVAQLSARSSALEDSLRALGTALLTQVRTCAATCSRLPCLAVSCAHRAAPATSRQMQVEELLGRLRSQGKTAHDPSKDSSAQAPRRLQVLCMHHLPYIHPHTSNVF